MKRLLGIILSFAVLIGSISTSLSFFAVADSAKAVLNVNERDSISESQYDTAVLSDRIVSNELTVYADLKGSICGAVVNTWTMRSLKDTEFYGSTYTHVYTPNCYSNSAAAPSITYSVCSGTKLMFAIGMISAMDELWDDFSILYSSDGAAFSTINSADISYSVQEDVAFSTYEYTVGDIRTYSVEVETDGFIKITFPNVADLNTIAKSVNATTYTRTGSVFVVPAAAFASDRKEVLEAGTRDVLNEEFYDKTVETDLIVDNDLTVYAELNGSIWGAPIDNWTLKSLKNTEFYGSTYTHVYTPNCYSNSAAAPSITYRVRGNTRLMFAIGMISAMDELWDSFSITYSNDGKTYNSVNAGRISYSVQEDVAFSTYDYTVGDIRTYTVSIANDGFVKITFPNVADLNAIAKEVNSTIYTRTGSVFIVPAAAFASDAIYAGVTDVFTASTDLCYDSTIYYANKETAYATINGLFVKMGSDNISKWIYDDYGTDYSLLGKTYVSPTASAGTRYIDYRISPDTFVEFDIAMWEAVWTAMTEKGTTFSFEVDKGNGFAAVDEADLKYTTNANGTVRYYQYFADESCVFRITCPDMSLIAEYFNTNKPAGQNSSIVYRGAFLISAFSASKYAYSPVKAERYYTENIVAPKTISAHIKTNEKIFGGAVVSSKDFTLDIANKGYPRVTFSDGNEIVFPVDVRGDSFNHIAVSYNTEAGEWYLYLNGTKVSTVTGAAISAETIDKLYVGASADEYNNNYFKGAITELAVFSEMLDDAKIFALTDSVDTAADSLIACWNLGGGDKTDSSPNGKALLSEAVSVVTEQPESAVTFTKQKERLDSYEIYTSAVNTFETWLKVDSEYSVDKAPGCILSSYYGSSSNTSVDYLQISIGTGGNPLLEIRSGGVAESFRFDVDVTTGKWLHLTIAADYESGFYNCYIDGQLADSIEVGALQIPVSHRAYAVSGYYMGGNVATVYFDGSLAGMKLYSDLRTAQEIYSDVYSTDISDNNLMAYWKLQNNSEGLKDLKGTNDLHLVLTDTPDESVDESFGNYSTFVFIPDTQYLTEAKGEEGLSYITNWILDNKESENIVGVMGLGDITDNNNDADWSAAAAAYESLKGQVPYVFIGGNHDIEQENPSADNLRDDSMFNQYFPYADWEPYMSGFFEEGKIDNMYYLLEDVNGEKYMMLGLEFQPRDAVLEWANELVEEYSDYKVIVATHGYQYEDGVTGENTYVSSNSYTHTVGTDANYGSQIWEKFVSQHENIQAILCGHTGTENVCYTTKTGVNGNTVAEFIANGQYIERPFGWLAAIMILRISEDGTKANVNYYSTYQDKYIKDLNQFNIDWIDSYVAEADGVKYETLSEAISALSEGSTITLLENITVTDTIAISKNIKIDTASFKITNNIGAAVFDIADGMGMSIINGIYTFAASEIIADTDQDGNVSAFDLSYLRDKIMDDITDTKYFDINGDGVYNAVDIVKTKKISAKTN